MLLATRIGLALGAEVFTWRMTRGLEDEPGTGRSDRETEHAPELHTQARASAHSP